MKHLYKNLVLTISLTIVLQSLLMAQSLNSGTMTREERKSQINQLIDLNSKAEELGIQAEQLQSILSSVSSRTGGGDEPLPEAIQERFFTGQNAYDWFGYSVANAGDVNGDGFDDIIIGAPNHDAIASNAGRAYIFYGGAIVNNVPDVILIAENVINGYFGHSVAGIGDFNGDGFDDVAVGAPGTDFGGTDVGTIYIFLGGNPMNGNYNFLSDGSLAGERLGSSISGAGDVNGDGYADLIAGAPNNSSSTGLANIYYGSAAPSPYLAPDLILTGQTTFDYFGYSVSTSGDVNGDGYSDVIVGAYGNDAGGTDFGSAFIYYGGSPMNNIADVILTGEAADDRFGYSVSIAGDVNDDGYSDVIIGAYGNDAGGSNAGRAYIYFGGPIITNTPDVIFTGLTAGDLFGFSVSSAGDVNGDGYDDLIVGAPGNDAGGSVAGRAYIYFGSENMDSMVDVILTGAAAGDNFGFSVSTAGDVNGDGYSDVIVGAHLNSAGGMNAGRAYLYLNSLTGYDIPDEFFTGAAAGDNLGISVSTAGDVNGDGFDDIIVGAPNNDAGGNNAGRAYIYFGGPMLSNFPNVILTGAAAFDYFGRSVSTAGDVNGDGYDDIIVGAPNNDAGGTNAGRAYIYYGGPGMNNIADVILTGAAAGDNFGVSVSTAGDVNGDGYSDVIVGASGFNSNIGRAYIYYGGPGMNNIADVILTGVFVAGDYYGISVSGAGDVNGDGYSDVIVGAHNNDDGGTDAGRAYIYYGGASMDNIADVILTGAAAGDEFGISVSGAGDVNRDGYSDVIVGAWRNAAGGWNAGRAYIYFGGANMDNLADVILTGSTDADFLGISVSSAGDINGDGYSDVIVGAPWNDDGGSGAGSAYIYYGGANMDNIADVILTGAAAFDNFGISVSSAGDINGDGLSDVIVGAPFNGAGGTDAGRAYLYLSSAPPVKPRIMSVRDVPFDQGGFVRVRWNRSAYDVQGQNRISEYILQRSDPPGQSGFVWDYVASIPAVRELQYSFVAPTPSDSFSNSSGTFYFRVMARGFNPDERWYSNIKSGYSVDNLAPAAPLNFYAALQGSNVKLGWKANTEPDLYNYIIYRTDYPNANPDTLTIYAQSIDTTFIDTTPLTGTAYYYLRAQDVHNNLSSSVSASPGGLTTALTVFIENGWNMVSIPGLHPVNQNVNTWWVDKNPAANVFKYTAAGYQTVTEATPGEGYWMKHVGNRVYSTGDEWPASGIFIVPNLPLNGIAGWNLIGGYEQTVSTSGITTTPPGLQQGSVFGYSSSSGYTITPNLVPGYSYWLRLGGDAQINIPASLEKINTPELELVEESWGRIMVRDNTDKSYVLYALESSSNADQFLLPPAPPDGMFDVRYSSNRYAEIINIQSATIELRGVEYPVRIVVEKMSLRVQDLTGELLNTELKSGEELIINNPAIEKLVVHSELIPTEFALFQNYPNPFNPSTTISWQSPVSGQQVLKVYDVLGNKVATLVDEYREAGSHSVTFKATHIASGMYLYRLKVGAFVETRKMLLLR